jgi:hypothetical protein
MEDQKISKDGSKTQEVEVQKKIRLAGLRPARPAIAMCDRGVTGVFKKKEAPQAQNLLHQDTKMNWKWLQKLDHKVDGRKGEEEDRECLPNRACKGWTQGIRK